MSLKALVAAALAWGLAAAPALAMAVTETTVRVHVDGAVRRPGVVRVAPGSRVAEAIAAAGGPLPAARLTGLNLASPVADGGRCHVPTAAEAAPAKPVAAPVHRSRQIRKAAAPKRPVAVVDLNAATAAELDTLPGVGPAMVGRILDVRKRLGRFKAVEELREVPGIGAKRLARLRPLVVIR